MSADASPDTATRSFRHEAALAATVALGGALGGLARWLLTLAVPDPGPRADTLPWTTWTINVAGAAALAALPLLLARLRDPARRELLGGLLGPGFLGGYTTLSAYALVAQGLLEEGAVTTVLLLLGSTLAASLVAVHVVRRMR